MKKLGMFLFLTFISLPLFSYDNVRNQNSGSDHQALARCYGTYQIPYENLMTGEIEYQTTTVYLGEVFGITAATECAMRVQSYYNIYIAPYLQD